MYLPQCGFLDNIYSYLKNRALRTAAPLFFSKGWGDAAASEAVRQRARSRGEPAAINVQWESSWIARHGGVARDGFFETPLFREYLSPECRTAYFRLILPGSEEPHPVCVVMATTGEEGYAAREVAMSVPLLARGIGTLLLEHPFLGRRRPADQASCRLNVVSDLLLLGGVVIEEARSLLTWLRLGGFTRLGVSGVSMGGHLAALAGAQTPFGVAIVPCVAPHSGVPVFTEGLLSDECDWIALADEYGSGDRARNRLRQLLDFTSVDLFPPACSNNMVIFVAAIDDRYVPKDSTQALRMHWPHAEVRWLRGGHISSIVRHKSVFRAAIVDAMMQLDPALR